MRRLFRLLAAFYEKHALGIDLALVAMGAEAVRRRVVDLNDRLESIEERGTAPLDDLVSLRDLGKVAERVGELERRAGVVAVLDVEAIDDDDEAAGAGD